MKSRKAVLQLKQDNLGNQGVRLYDDDLLLLEQLLIHQSINFKSVYELLKCYETVPGNIRGINAVSNRLKKLRDAGLIVLRMKKHKGNVYTSHYRIAKRGVDVLNYLGYTNQEETDSQYKIIRKLSFPSEHTQGASYIANQIFLRCLSKDKLSNVTHFRGDAHPHYAHNIELSIEERNAVIPDWVFSNENLDVCIEIDTGTQRGDIISAKCDAYMRKAKQLKAKNVKLAVVFSVIDSSIEVLHNYSDNRSRRIASIKELVPPFSEWPDNLYFYVLSARRTPPLIERFLEYPEKMLIEKKTLERYYLADDLLRKMNYVLGDKNHLEEFNKESVFKGNRNKAVDCDLVAELSTGTNKQRYAVIYGQEGSVITSQRIEANEKRLFEVKERKEKVGVDMLVFYDERAAMEEDVYGRGVSINLWQTDFLSWVTAMNGEGSEVPPVYLVVSPFKKEMRGLPV